MPNTRTTPSRLILPLLLALAGPLPAGAGTAPREGGAATAPVPSHALETGAPSEEERLAERMLGWSGFAQGGYVHQFSAYESNTDGHFHVDRFFVQTGVSYAPDLLRRVSLSVGYGFDSFAFAGTRGLASLSPWQTVHNFRISLPVRWGFDRRWTLFVIPTIRTALEEGAVVTDGLQGGGFAGVSYRVSDRLTIGPGVGVITEIEDAPTVFPVLLIDWKITERLDLSTGRGVGATLGPGLVLSYQATEKWRLSLGGRYEKLRFRLNGRGVAPNGVGEDRSFPLYAGLAYSIYPMGTIRLMGGVEIGEQERLADAGGNLLYKQHYHPAGFVGLSFSFRF